MSETEVSVFSSPMFIIGDKNVGKNTFLSQISDNSLLSVSDERFNVKITSKLIISNIADLPTNPFGIILIYNLTDIKSFQYIENIISSLPNSQLKVLIGTHRDLQSDRQVQYDDIQIFKKENNLIWFEFASNNVKQAEILKKQLFIRSVFAIRNLIENDYQIPQLSEQQSQKYEQLCQIVQEEQQEQSQSDQDQEQQQQYVKAEIMNLSDIISSDSQKCLSPVTYVKNTLSPQVPQVKTSQKTIRYQDQLKTTVPKKQIPVQQPVLKIDLQLEDKVYSLKVCRDDVAYDLAKDFVIKNHLSHGYIKQISLLILDRLSSFIEEEKVEQLRKKKQQILDYPFNEPKFLQKEVKKILFKFELTVASKTITVAWRENDDAKSVAIGLIKTMGLKEDLYYTFIVSKINEILSLWKISQDE